MLGRRQASDARDWRFSSAAGYAREQLSPVRAWTSRGEMRSCRYRCPEARKAIKRKLKRVGGGRRRSCNPLGWFTGCQKQASRGGVIGDRVPSLAKQF